MIFNSVKYIIFLTTAVIIYYLVPNRFRWIPLLGLSYYFCYSLGIELLIWMVVITAISYTAGLILENHRRKCICAIAVVSILSVLFVYKYLNFTIEQINNCLRLIRVDYKLSGIKSLVMPIGISFFSFQAVGYVVDVFKAKIKAYRHPGKYALYMAFFPHIMQGPIDRSDNLLPQLDEVQHFKSNSFRHAFLMILLGMFKKVVIADRLTALVDLVFNNVTAYSGQYLWVASIFYTFQIYCDFSGYTDIALGSAELFGFRLVENFRTPYLANSIADFWRKWHMSLSRWFRDYIYIPLGGNRVSELRWALNVLIVFFISGLWHGADWTFILWGVLHGVFQIIEKYRDRLLKKFENNALIRVVKTIVTFLIVNYLWILFRANTMDDFISIFNNILKIDPKFNYFNLDLQREELIFSIILIVFVILFDILNSKTDVVQNISNSCLPIRWTVYIALIMVIIMFGIYGNLSTSSFIYFNF